MEEELNEDKITLLGEVDKAKDFNEKEFENLWGSEVLGITGAKKPGHSKQKERSKNVRYSNNTKQENF